MKVSVITAVYNNATHVEDAILSVLSQKNIDIEYIIVDGASTDGTIQIINKYQSKIDKFVSGRDGGIYEALNKGLSLATGDYVGYLHSDDLLSHDSILHDLFRAAPKNTDILYGDIEFVSRDNIHKIVRHWRSSSFSPSLIQKGWMPPHPSLYVKRDLLNSISGFDTKFRISADYDLIIKLFSLPMVTHYYHPETIVKMRTGGASNNSFKNLIKKFNENVEILNNHGLSAQWVAARKILSKIHQYF